MTRLYELNDQLRAIDDLLASGVDEETNEILESTRDRLLSDINIKVENILEYIAHCKSRIDYLKSEEQRVGNKRKSFEKRVDWLKGLVMGQLKQKGVRKADFGTYTVSIAKTPAKVVLTDDAMEWLPDNMCTITRVPNKTAIKQAMGAVTSLKVIHDGQEIVVATLDDTGETLRIK